MKFNSENAREFALRSAKVRSFLRSNPPNKPKPEPAPLPAVTYAERCLARTRAQLDLVADQITEELKKSKLDERKLKTLTEAQDRLQEAERKLAGRPLPGSHRPRQAGPAAPVAGAWLDDPPAPLPAPLPVPPVALVEAAPSLPPVPEVNTAACGQSPQVTPPQVV